MRLKRKWWWAVPACSLSGSVSLTLSLPISVFVCLSPSHKSVALREAGSHAVKIPKHLCRGHMPCGALRSPARGQVMDCLESGTPAPLAFVWLWPHEGPGAQTTSSAATKFQTHRNCGIINVWCFEPLSLGLICYTVTDSWYTTKLLSKGVILIYIPNSNSKSPSCSVYLATLGIVCFVFLFWPFWWVYGNIILHFKFAFNLRFSDDKWSWVPYINWPFEYLLWSACSSHFCPFF